MAYFKILGDDHKAVLRVYDSSGTHDYDIDNEKALFLLHSLVDLLWKHRNITNRNEPGPY